MFFAKILLETSWQSCFTYNCRWEISRQPSSQGYDGNLEDFRESVDARKTNRYEVAAQT
jgi:hypothetical protein